MTRLRSLDGLRGIAALIVVFHHLSLLNPSVAALYLDQNVEPPAPGSALWFLTSTPLQLLVSGQEAVLIFFVLSGWVVALPALRPGFDWLAYYPRRIVRLLLPVIASVGLATVIILATPQDPARASSAWVAAYSFPDLDWQTVVLNTELLYGEATLNNPLWTLRWELLFSVLLPVFVVLAVLARSRLGLVLTVLGSIAVMGLGEALGSLVLVLLPVFLLGTLIAVHRARIADVAEQWTSTPVRTALVVVGLIVALLALDARWVLWPLGPHSTELRSASAVIAAVGAAAVVLLAAFWRPLARLLETRPVQWLGRISFSLYLVHVPIVIGVSSVVSALIGPERWWLAALIALPVALVVAALFARFVEGPAHRLSRRVGQGARVVMDSR